MKKLNHLTKTGTLLLLVLYVVSIATIHAQDDQNEGTYIELKMHSTSLENNFLGDSPDRFVSVYLPPGYYSSPEKHYPVIYFLHGFNFSHTTYFGGYVADFKFICDKLISSGVIDPIIVVSPNSYNKYGGSFYVNSLVTGNWEDYIVRDVTQFMDRNFRTLPQAESRGLAGHSMGGSGTFRLSMHYPDVYAAAYSLSGPPDVEETFLEPRKDDLINLRHAKTLPGDWELMMCVAALAAFSPDTAALPFFVQFPFNDSGERIDSVWQKFLNFDPLTQLPSFKDNLLKLKAIQFDIGINDVSTLINGNRNYSEALTDFGIPHIFEEFDGGHSDKVAQRIETKVLPFFNTNLSDTMISDTISPELIQWQGIVAKENFSLNETINLDTTIWNSDSVRYKILSGDAKSLFSIDNINRTISADSMMINYEEKDAYDLLVEATYRNGQEIVSDTADIYIRVENVLEPTQIFDTTFEVAENSEPNTVIGTVPVDNIENVPLSFRIIDGNINRTFKINNQGIIQISNNDSLDYETYQQFVLQVVMIEGSGAKSRDTATITVNVLDVVSNAKNFNSPEIEIYPNPVKDVICFDLPAGIQDGFEVSLFNIIGKLVLQKQIFNNQLDISKLNTGIYLVRLNLKDKTVVRKIIKE